MSEVIPTKDKRIIFMRSVYEWASCSKDPRTHIGAVLVKDNVPISSGFNNFPRKVVDLKSRYEDRPTKLKFILHAESNCVLNAARMGRCTENTILYTQGVPCQECMKIVINAGVIKIVCHREWPNLTYSPQWVESFEYSEIMRREAGIELEWFSGTLGVQGFLDSKFINL
jgi:dCMP deaminase